MRGQTAEEGRVLHFEVSENFRGSGAVAPLPEFEVALESLHRLCKGSL